MTSTIPIYIFAKAPVIGQVKTRMVPPLTHTTAAYLATALLEHCVANVTANWPGEVVLCVTPDAQHDAFQQVLSTYKLRTYTQCAGDLGARLEDALQDGFSHSQAAAVLGVDIPHVSAAALLALHECLVRGDNAIGGTADGGFYALGANTVAQGHFADLFANVVWGGAQVRRQVMDNALTMNYALQQLPEHRDIDEYADLQWLAAEHPRYNRWLRDMD